MSRFNLLPPSQKRRITACVGFIVPQDQPEKLVCIKNKRGWDIPGGHVEANELPLEAFSRELLEESGCSLLPGSSLVAILESKKNPATGIAVYCGTCKAGQFTPTKEIENRKFASINELLEDYFGDKELLGELIRRCINY